MISAVTLPRRRGLACAALALSLVSLTGCGGSDSKAGSDAPGTPTGTSTSTASTDTSTTPDADTSTHSTPDGDGDSDGNDNGDNGDDGDGDGKSADPELEPFLDAYSAAIEKATTAHLRVQVTDSATANVDVEGQADFKSDPPLFEIVIKDPKKASNDARYLVAGADMYIQIPGKDQYYKVDASQNPLGASGGGVLDPQSMVDQLRGGITDVADEGAETRDGVQVHHYAIAVDTATLIKQAGADPRETKLPKTLEYNVYLDAQGRLQGINADLGQTVGTFDVVYTRWGEPVNIEIPSGKQLYQPPADN